MVVAYDNGPVGVAENDLGAHINELVHEEEPALEHLLVNEHAALALGGDDEHHAQKVRGEARPRSVGKSHYGAVDEGFYLVAFLGGDIDVVPLLEQLHSQAAETLRDDAEVLPGDIFDGEFTLGDGRHSYEGADFNHIGKDPVAGSMQFLYSCDCQQVGAYALDLGTHSGKHTAELLDIGFAGGVIYGRGAFGEAGGHYDVGRAGDRSLIEKHIAAAHIPAVGEVVGALVAVVGAGGPQFHKAVDVGVNPAAADAVSSRLGEEGLAEAREQRSHHHHGAAELGTSPDELLASDVELVHVARAEAVLSLFELLHRHAHTFQQGDEVLDIQDVRQVGYGHGLCGEEHGTEHLQGLVLGALGLYASAQRAAAFNYK